jgi:carbonic anhydrase
VVLALAALLLSAGASRADGPGPHWRYGPHQHGGPQHWAELDPKFEACAQGQRQSPIDIRAAVKTDLPALQFQYAGAAEATWVNNGHTVQLNLPAGSSLTVGERVFNLLQFHLHTPSEEAVGGKRFDMVAHFVHRDAQGQLGVVAVLFKRGKAHPVWQNVLAHLPREGESITVAELKLLKTPLSLRGTQLATFRKLCALNARPLQPAHARLIQESR